RTSTGENAFHQSRYFSLTEGLSAIFPPSTHGPFNAERYLRTMFSFSGFSAQSSRFHLVKTTDDPARFPQDIPI
ncbi:MAG: hypothetical protein AAFY72_14225, partial [Cyanobacteria bacterium J06649_4]